ncbi:MarR family transcriptional regulator [Desemzia sp. RIT804]|uniref:MarR family winged helix-turn-helix transcriptional regulator n=1 Tax=Desemzia sp. RIT 804 TaxID=2810209 RepID=UPI00195273CF|nr:MarR family transcriptional regulator [Desemzia sp. RIT 804]
MGEYQKYISFSLHATSQQIKRSMAAKMSDILDDKANMMQPRIIGYIYNHKEEDVFQKDIEELLKIRRSTATGMLNTLEKKGLIHRKPVSYDARLKKLVITPEGIEFTEKALDCINTLESQVRSGLTEEELEIFFRVLSKIKKNIEDDE